MCFCGRWEGPAVAPVHILSSQSPRAVTVYTPLTLHLQQGESGRVLQYAYRLTLVGNP